VVAKRFIVCHLFVEIDKLFEADKRGRKKQIEAIFLKTAALSYS